MLRALLAPLLLLPLPPNHAAYPRSLLGRLIRRRTRAISSLSASLLRLFLARRRRAIGIVIGTALLALAFATLGVALAAAAALFRRGRFRLGVRSFFLLLTLLATALLKNTANEVVRKRDKD